MQRARNGGATVPAIDGRVVDFEFALTAETIDHVDFPAHLGRRDLGAGGRHRGAGGPTAGALGKYQVIKMAAQHGGFRKGAGRPKGSRNRATIARELRQREALASARAANASLSAIDYLLQVLRDPMAPRGAPNENGDVRRALSRIPSKG